MALCCGAKAARTGRFGAERAWAVYGWAGRRHSVASIFPGPFFEQNSDMRYFLDTEFNGTDGALLSLALVPEHGDQEFYVTLPQPDEIHPWVAKNVIPYLRFVPPGVDHDLSREQAAQHLEAYLAHDQDAIIIADWPDDLAYFCRLMITGPGDKIAVGALKFELINGMGFSAAASSKVPHNALHDARALKIFYQG